MLVKARVASHVELAGETKEEERLSSLLKFVGAMGTVRKQPLVYTTLSLFLKIFLLIKSSQVRHIPSAFPVLIICQIVHSRLEHKSHVILIYPY